MLPSRLLLPRPRQSPEACGTEPQACSNSADHTSAAPPSLNNTPSSNSANPANGNRYPYAAENPTTYTRPTGQDWTDYATECGKGAVQGLEVGVLTGADETGVGALGAPGNGCTEGLVTQAAADVLGEEGGQVAKGYFFVKPSRNSHTCYSPRPF